MKWYQSLLIEDFLLILNKENDKNKNKIYLRFLKLNCAFKTMSIIMAEIIMALLKSDF